MSSKDLNATENKKSMDNYYLKEDFSKKTRRRKSNLISPSLELIAPKKH